VLELVIMLAVVARRVAVVVLAILAAVAKGGL
jgi:hypothetical protein